jgi:ubiquinone/menaquinone biosynthesis C-methylase UbiE
MSKRAFDDFDVFADDYRQIHNQSIKISGTDSDYFSEQKIEEIKRRESQENINFLDLGCGDGNTAVFFQKYFPNSKYTGLDVSKESISVAKKRELKNTEFFDYNGFEIFFEDDTFDVIFIACVLHHIDFSHHKKILEEVKRVLKLGGRLYIFEHNPFNPVTRMVIKNCPFDEDAVLLSPYYTKKTLKQINFSNTEVAFTLFFPRNNIFSKLLFLEKKLKWLPLGGQYYTKSVK